MKEKSFAKKLVLNKKTVSNLDKLQMANLKGGVFTDSVLPGCNTNELYCTVATCDPYFCANTWVNTCDM
jgi:hypothetical protein